MYTLYYLNRNLQLGAIKVEFLDLPVLIPEDLVFCNLRKDINFIKEPHKCIAFTDFERLLMSSEFNDVSLIKDGDYRKQHSYLSPLCPIDGYTFGLYIVAYRDNKLHFDMDMPATGAYELETSYDDGLTWNRVLYYCSADEVVYMPDFPDTLIEDKLNGTSDFPTCNNSLDFNYEQADQKLRVTQGGVVLSQPMF